MSEMRIQDACSNCCAGIKEFASNTASWIGKTVTATGAFIAESAEKVAEFVKPYFENLKTFCQENKESILVAAIAFTLGAIAYAIINQVFCRGTNTPPPATTAVSVATTTP
jgi:phage-related protein